jgi:hypothetical protein
VAVLREPSAGQPERYDHNSGGEFKTLDDTSRPMNVSRLD